MNKHVIIAGTCRAGKTTLSLKLSKLGYTHYKMDSIKRGICSSLNINQHDWINISPWMAHLLDTIIKENASDTVFLQEQYVLDVSHLLPKDISYIDLSNTLIIFLGYDMISVEKQFELIRSNDKRHYWSYALSDQQLLNMIEANIEFSKYLKDECIKYHIPYFDTSFNRDEQIEKIKNYILENNIRR